MSLVLYRSKKKRVQFFIPEDLALKLLSINNLTTELLERMKGDIIKKVEKGKEITQKDKNRLKKWNNKIRDIKNNLEWTEVDDLTLCFKMVKLTNGRK
jgi:hypothetical protein